SVLNSGAESFILAGTFSKTWAMTGFRLGYAVSSKAVVDKMLGYISLMLTSVPEFVQYAAIKALGCKKEADENRRAMKRRAEVVGAEFGRIASLKYYKPDGAMYFFPEAKLRDFHAGRFSDSLLREKAVSITPGTAFGNYPASFRISLGQPEEVLVEAVRRIGEALG
ncbi:MAG: aminotransferase class I/II-fold pyridoxal phosphate-dependent enzyme, partial [Nitrososphaerota archaeon]|nr:aminotransferase class I/II-fold pyridoxal phosphate-dependent enzyme [Nitrososphaerota archaeon]